MARKSQKQKSKQDSDGQDNANGWPSPEEFDRGWWTYRRSDSGVTPSYQREFEYDRMRRDHADYGGGFFG